MKEEERGRGNRRRRWQASSLRSLFSGAREVADEDWQSWRRQSFLEPGRKTNRRSVSLDLGLVIRRPGFVDSGVVRASLEALRREVGLFSLSVQSVGSDKLRTVE